MATVLKDMMKRVAVTGFAILYIVMVCTISEYRTANWIEAATHRPDSLAFSSLGKAQVYVPHYRNARILQNQFVVEAPNIATGISMAVDRHLSLAVDSRIYDQSPTRVPSRAPPSLI